MRFLKVAPPVNVVGESALCGGISLRSHARLDEHYDNLPRLNRVLRVVRGLVGYEDSHISPTRLGNVAKVVLLDWRCFPAKDSLSIYISAKHMRLSNEIAAVVREPRSSERRE